MTSIKQLLWLAVSFFMQCIVVGETCNNTTEFRCSSGSCVPLGKVNNTVNDCGDNSDEGLGYCGHIISFKCTNGENCIPLEWVLDNAADCSDRSDETKIIGSECTDETEMSYPCDEWISKGVCINDTCTCIPGWFANDLGTACTEMVSGACDSSTEFTCVNSVCIPLEKINNTVNDCGDNSDEGPGVCVLKQGKARFKCSDSTVDNVNCQDISYVLDGFPDCFDKSDEAKIIGTPCSTDCCPCEDYIAGAECISGICQCPSGWMANNLGTACYKRDNPPARTTEADYFDGVYDGRTVSDAIYMYDNIWPERTVKSTVGSTVESTVKSIVESTVESTVESKTCPVGQTWNDCGSACSKTCDNPTPRCLAVCLPRCQCPSDTPIWHQDTCIKQEQCTNDDNQAVRTTAGAAPSTTESGPTVATGTRWHSTKKRNTAAGPASSPTTIEPKTATTTWLPISTCDRGIVIGLAVAVGFLCAGLGVSLMLHIWTCHRRQQNGNGPHDDKPAQFHDKPKPQLEEITVREKLETPGYLQLGFANQGVTEYAQLAHTDRKSHDSGYYQVIKPEQNVYEEIKDQREINLIIR